MEEEASTTSIEEEEESFKRWQLQVETWQWQPESVVTGGAPDCLLSEEDLQPGKVEFESMEAARDAITNSARVSRTLSMSASQTPNGL
jgi:hypothetical protein